MSEITPQIQILHQNFTENTSSELDIRFFEILVTYFPALLVIAADGVIDEDEWFYVEQLAGYMSKMFADELDEEMTVQEVREHFIANMHILVDNLAVWETPFIDALAHFLETNEDDKDTIYEVMEMFAESSEGISDIEQEKIDELSARLNLLDD